jgi:hypothetical protein
MQTYELSREKNLRKANRAFARSMFPMDTVVRYRALGWNNQQKGVLHSISQGGLYVKSLHIPEIGSQLTLNFIFGRKAIHCQGIVIYRRIDNGDFSTKGFGIKFTRMVTDEYQIIKNTIDEFVKTMSV